MSKKNKQKNNSSKQRDVKTVETQTTSVQEGMMGAQEVSPISAEAPLMSSENSEYEFNAFQRILIKIGKIPVEELKQTETLNQLRSDCESLRQENNDLKKQVDSFEGAIKSIESYLDNPSHDSGREIFLTNDKIVRIITSIGNLYKKNTDFQVTIQNLKNNLENLKKPKESSHEVITKVTSPTTIDNDELIKLKKDYQELYDKYQKSENQRKTTAISRDSFKDQVDTLSKEKDQLESDLNAQISDLNTKIEELRTGIDSQVKENKALLEEKSNLSELNSKAGDMIKTLKGKIDELEKTEVGEIALKLSDVQNALSSSAEKIADLNHEIESLKEEIESHQATINAKAAEMEDLRSQKDKEIHAIDEEKKQLNSQIQDLSNQLSEAKKENKDKKEEIKTLKKKVDTKEKEINKVTEDLESQKIKNSNLVQEVENKSLELTSALSDIKDLQRDNKAKDQNISELNSKIETAQKDIQEAKQKLSESQATARKSVAEFHSLIMNEAQKAMQILEDGHYEKGSGDIMETCQDDEDYNRRLFHKLVDKLEEINPDNYATVKDIKEAILNVFSADINKESEGIITPLTRLYAYSRMPFMREDQGEDYMILDYSKLSLLHQHISSMLGAVGISLIIPTPYSDKINEGEYESRPGELPNLDYICPNARVHLDKVDRENAKDVITDIVCIGYRIPGQPDQKARVLL